MKTKQDWINEANRRYQAKLNLLAKVERETAPELAAMRKAQDLLDRVSRTQQGIEFQGYANRKGSICEPYTLGNLRGTESLVDGASFEACAMAGMDKAEQTTRNVADNNL